MYASAHPYTTDEKTGKRKYVNLHWGTVADGNKFIPGKRYIFASPKERAEFVFPKRWDLSEAHKLSGAKAAGWPAYVDDDKNRFYGDIWLLELVAAKTGLRDDLNRVFKEMPSMWTAFSHLRTSPFSPDTPTIASPAGSVSRRLRMARNFLRPQSHI